MTRQKSVVRVFATVTAAFIIAWPTLTDAAKEPAKSAQPEMKLPPGWTMDDMKACMAAGTPGKMHEFLTKDAGEWTGKCQMWMGPSSEPMSNECTSTVEPIMDGRYVMVHMKGEMPGMGPFKGGGVYGYDNVSKK